MFYAVVQMVAHYIETASALDAWLKVLEQATVIGVDTESDSFHHYREKVCLIQMSALDQDAILDPLALKGLAKLAPIFKDPNKVKIFHDACYDLACLQRDFDFEVHSIFDTMVASRLLGYKQFGLAALLQHHFQFTLDKRWQRSDWAKRPLLPEQLEYARYDTHFLIRLREILLKELKTHHRLDWAMQDFERLPELAARLPARSAHKNPDHFWRMKGLHALSPLAKGRVHALYLLREQWAEQQDKPPFRVLHDSVLIDLAEHPPMSMATFHPRSGLRRLGIERYGERILQALHQAEPLYAEAKNPSKRRKGKALEGDAKTRYEELRQLRIEKATALKLDPEVLLSNAALQSLVSNPQDAERMSEAQTWRKEFISLALEHLVLNKHSV